jgi:hypothetical protein
MKKITTIFLAVIFTLTLFYGFSAATNFTPEQAECPLCGNKVKINSLMSTNSFGGHDRDFLSYASGDQPLLILPAACDKCYYSGYSKDFETVEAEVLAKLKDEILTKKNISPPSGILYELKAATAPASASMPAFIKYDLIAQTYKIAGKETSEIFSQYLNAAWALRLAHELCFDLRSPEAQNAVVWMRKNIDLTSIDTTENNNAASELATGRLLLKRSAGLAGDDLLNCSFVALFFLRSHGENREAEKALENLRHVLNPALFDTLEKKVKESIALERKYLRLALEALESDLAAGKITGDFQLAQMYYLAGELCRRCLDFGAAKKYYQKADSLQKLTAPIDRYAKEQQELCD